MTFGEILNEATTYLKRGNISDAKTDAWQLMEFVWGINRSYYFAHSDDIIEAEKKEQYMTLIHRRSEHIPVQLLTNQAHFMGHTFYVNGDVLIPRLDTEILVEEVSKVVQRGDKILDLCTGSGCIIISLLLDNQEKDLQGVAIDVSAGAIAVAKVNAKLLDVDVEFIESNLFEKSEDKYNVIVSNPPYIRTAVIEELMPEVREHEPLLALDGSDDGLHFYRKIVTQAADFLTEEGWLAFEVGYDQGMDVSEMMTSSGYIDVKVIKDLAGLDRVVIGQRGN